MSTLAEIASAAAHLPAGQQEELIRFLTATRREQPSEVTRPQPYRVPTHPGGVRTEIDADKLGQVPDEL